MWPRQTPVPHRPPVGRYRLARAATRTASAAEARAASSGSGVSWISIPGRSTRAASAAARILRFAPKSTGSIRPARAADCPLDRRGVDRIDDRQADWPLFAGKILDMLEAVGRPPRFHGHRTAERARYLNVGGSHTEPARNDDLAVLSTAQAVKLYPARPFIERCDGYLGYRQVALLEHSGNIERQAIEPGSGAGETGGDRGDKQAHRKPALRKCGAKVRICRQRPVDAMSGDIGRETRVAAHIAHRDPVFDPGPVTGRQGARRAVGDDPVHAHFWNT